MIETATALSRRDELSEYCSPLAYGAASLQGLERRLPGRLAGKVVSQLRRRATPAEIPADRLVRTAAIPEIMTVLALRLRLSDPAFSAVAQARAGAFDRAVSRRLRPGMGAVIGYQDTTLRTFQAARRLGIPTVLDFPVPPWRTIVELLQEEARLVPEYAPTLQGHKFDSWRTRRYDAQIPMADRLIMLSSYHQRTFEREGVDPERMFIAPLGVDPDLFTARDEPSEGPFRVVFVGQISQRKGISYLVEGFRKAELPDAELVFVGRPVGPREPWIDTPGVRHIPAVARFELPGILRDAHVTVLPSLIEGFGASALEGMACGLPAIVSEHTFGHDVIEDGVDGWVLPIRDAEGIARHLRTLYEDRNLQRSMARAARLKAEQFPWTRYGESVCRGIAPLLEDGQPAPDSSPP